ncbi:MAG: hypothetical protein AAFX87_16255 [Bacteroidota bacterium]
MIKSIAYLTWQLIESNVQLPTLPKSELMMSCESGNSLIFPKDLRTHVKDIAFSGDSAFYLHRYSTSDIGAVLMSILSQDQDRLPEKEQLDAEVETLDDEVFKQSYISDFIGTQLSEITPALEELQSQLPAELHQTDLTPEGLMGLFIDIELNINPSSFWSEVFQQDIASMHLLAFDGWDGNSKEVLASHDRHIYHLALIYS